MMVEKLETVESLQKIEISRTALKALSKVPQMTCGALSPLARINPPAGPEARPELIKVLTEMSGPWEWAVPALIDPHLTVGLLLGDGEEALIGQYLWSDTEGLGPGFKVTIQDPDLQLAGPIALANIEIGFIDSLALDGVAEVEPIRLQLSSDQFWALTALIDAYRNAVLGRRLTRTLGFPPGVTAEGIKMAWRAGLANPDPSWSVSLFKLLIPDAVPPNFEARLPQVISEMEDANLLTRLEGEPDDPVGDIYLFEEGLEILIQSVTQRALHLGLVVQRIRTPGQVEATVFGGWRTPAGIWLADLSGIGTEKGENSDQIELLLVGPTFMSGLSEQIFGLEEGIKAVSFDEYKLETPCSREAILEALRRGEIEKPATPVRPQPPFVQVTPPPRAGQVFCTSCGAALKPGVSFCGQCGSSIQLPEPTPTTEAPEFCTQCGAHIRPGVRFCGKCGAQV
jgi:hypothetical protein